MSELSRCPQCGTAKPTLVLQHVVYKNALSTGHENWAAWAVYQCTSCLDVVCFETILPHYKELSQLQLQMIQRRYNGWNILPGFGTEALQDWPDTAKNFMQQAVESGSAPDGAVMLAGSAVDAMLKAKGLEKGTVYERINKAVVDGLLTEAMGEWAHAVRLASNNPRHADLNSPHATSAQAEASMEFAKALGQFLFALPAKVQRGKDAAENTLTGED